MSAAASSTSRLANSPASGGGFDRPQVAITIGLEWRLPPARAPRPGRRDGRPDTGANRGRAQGHHRSRCRHRCGWAGTASLWTWPHALPSRFRTAWRVLTAAKDPPKEAQGRRDTTQEAVEPPGAVPALDLLEHVVTSPELTRIGGAGRLG